MPTLAVGVFFSVFRVSAWPRERGHGTHFCRAANCGLGENYASVGCFA